MWVKITPPLKSLFMTLDANNNDDWKVLILMFLGIIMLFVGIFA